MNHYPMFMASLQMLDAPFSLMNGNEIVANLSKGDVSTLSPEATYLVDKRDGAVLAQCIDDGNMMPALTWMHPQGMDRWEEFTARC